MPFASHVVVFVPKKKGGGKGHRPAEEPPRRKTARAAVTAAAQATYSSSSSAVRRSEPAVARPSRSASMASSSSSTIADLTCRQPLTFLKEKKRKNKTMLRITEWAEFLEMKTDDARATAFESYPQQLVFWNFFRPRCLHLLHDIRLNLPWPPCSSLLSKNLQMALRLTSSRHVDSTLPSSRRQRSSNK